MAKCSLDAAVTAFKAKDRSRGDIKALCKALCFESISALQGDQELVVKSLAAAIAKEEVC
jgi:hypothetical protein